MKRLTALLLTFLLVFALFPAAEAVDTPKYAAFTFDDGPSRTITPALLDALEERGVHVTFFVNGKNAERYPDIVLRAAAEGHQIANHTYSHTALTKLSDEKVLYEVSRTQDYLSKLLGEDEYMVRVPYGALNDRVQGLIDVPLILWSVDPTSGRVMTAAKMRDGIVKTAHDGAIILMHDTSTANLNASIEAIDKLMEGGYIFVTLNELFALKDEVPAAGTVTYRLSGETVGAYADEASLSAHWAYSDIELVRDAGLLTDDARGFRPDWGMTRAEAVTVLYRLAGEPKAASAALFDDVRPGVWYEAAVSWAVEEGIVSGISDRLFGAQGYVTKEQFYTFFARYLDAENTGVAEVSKAELLPGDEAVSTWAAPSVNHLRACGFTSAERVNRFAPRSGMTRAEAAELLAWYMKKTASV